jgi:hypothetical protein
VADRVQSGESVAGDGLPGSGVVPLVGFEAADGAVVQPAAGDRGGDGRGVPCGHADSALGLLEDVPACTDLVSKPWVAEAGVEVLNQPFFAQGNVATAGGCLASPYLAAWIIARLEGDDAAESALHYVAPVGEKEEYVARALRNIAPYLAVPSGLS